MISKDPSEPLKSGISEYDSLAFFFSSQALSQPLYGRETTTRIVLSCIKNWFRTTLAEGLEESSHQPERFIHSIGTGTQHFGTPSLLPLFLSH